jgi:hypothetical protein
MLAWWHSDGVTTKNRAFDESNNLWRWWRRWMWRGTQVAGGAVVQVAAGAVVQAGGGAVVQAASRRRRWCLGSGPICWVFYLGKILRQERERCGLLGTYPARGAPPALGEGTFTGRSVSRGLRREQAVGEGFNVKKSPFAERNLTLGEGPESGNA